MLSKMKEELEGMQDIERRVIILRQLIRRRRQELQSGYGRVQRSLRAITERERGELEKEMESESSDDDVEETFEAPFGVGGLSVYVGTTTDPIDLDVLSLFVGTATDQVNSDVPFSSEMHATQLKTGETLPGGMPGRGRVKGRMRRSGKPRVGKKSFPVGHSFTKMSRQCPVPSEARGRLRWFGHALISAAASTARKTFAFNSVADPEQTASPGVCAYKDEMNYIWGQTRVLVGAFSAMLSNLEAFPVQVWVLWSNTDPGASTVSADVWAGQPFGFMMMLSAKGGIDKIRYFRRHTAEEIAGTKEVYTSPNYAAVVGTDPADLLWVTIYVSSMGAGNLTNGVRMAWGLEQDTLWTNRRSDVTAGPLRIQLDAPSVIRDEKSDLLEQISTLTARFASLQTT